MESIHEVILNINKEFPEIGWGVAGSISGKSVEIGREITLQRWRKGDAKYFWITYFSDSSEVVEKCKKAKNYLVIIDVDIKEIEESPAQTLSIAVGKKGKLSEIITRIDNGELAFSIKQDFFTCYFIKFDEKDYLEKVNNILRFKNLKEFRDSLSITFSDWNDYGYYTVLYVNIWKEKFWLRVNPRSQEMIDYLKGTGKKPMLDDGTDLCSLGGVEYYEFLKKYLPYSVRQQWFSITKDLAFNRKNLDKASRKYEDFADPYAADFKMEPPYGKSHNFFNNSFMRTTSVKEIKDIFRPLAVAGYGEESVAEDKEMQEGPKKSVDENIVSIDYDFGDEKVGLSFVKNRSSDLSTEVYAIIGGNGSGKSFRINEIIKRHMEGDNNFSSIIHFSLSPFDSVIEYQKNDKKYEVRSIEEDDEGVLYEKIGFVSVETPRINQVINKLQGQQLKNIIDWLKDKYSIDDSTEKSVKKLTMKDSFTFYIQDVLLDFIATSDKKFELWLNCLELFAFEQWARDIIDAFRDKEFQLNDFKKLSELSSGQATILLYLTKLVSSINRGCLVIFDEPETFMHPPMIKAFIRAVAKICKEEKAFCLTATHSPIVLQEIPHKCIYTLNAEHELRNVSYKTFGENLDSLYKNVYGVELQMTGYNNILTERRNFLIDSINKVADKEVEENKLSQESDSLLNTQASSISDREKNEEHSIERFPIFSNASDKNLLGDEAYLKYLIIEEEIKTYINSKNNDIHPKQGE
ncbi:TPA: ATP-binding protein [Streptococcus suis]|nr:ATP-binding protein [Streptococcus suis]HEL2460007.1 ATP-binding protein [Streptococcus suis]HEM2771742.1 ATP-binding protein [Streptococcus suis]